MVVAAEPSGRGQEHVVVTAATGRSEAVDVLCGGGVTQAARAGWTPAHHGTGVVIGGDGVRLASAIRCRGGGTAKEYVLRALAGGLALGAGEGLDHFGVRLTKGGLSCSTRQGVRRRVEPTMSGSVRG